MHDLVVAIQRSLKSDAGVITDHHDVTYGILAMYEVFTLTTPEEILVIERLNCRACQ